MAKLAVTPPVVGSVSNGDVETAPRRLCRRTAPLVLAICIRESMPLLHPRAAGDGEADHRAGAAAVAYSNSRVIFSPTAVPMEPIMKYGSMTNRAAGLAADAGRAAEHGLRLAAGGAGRAPASRA